MTGSQLSVGLSGHIATIGEHPSMLGDARLCVKGQHRILERRNLEYQDNIPELKLNIIRKGNSSDSGHSRI